MYLIGERFRQRESVVPRLRGQRELGVPGEQRGGRGTGAGQRVSEGR